MGDPQGGVARRLGELSRLFDSVLVDELPEDYYEFKSMMFNRLT